MARTLSVGSLIWLVGPVQFSVFQERSLFIVQGPQPQTLQPYYTQSVWTVLMLLKRPPPTEVLLDVSVFPSVDGIHFPPAGAAHWSWRTNTDIPTGQAIARSAAMHWDPGSPPGEPHRTGLMPQHWLLQYSATSIGAIPQMTFLVSGHFTGNVPYGLE